MSSATRPLLQLAPTIPFIPLVARTPALKTHVLDGVTILIKSDADIADHYAGNKVRKLEFLLAQARARGRSTLVTVGAIGSNHALATTVHGTRAGFAVRVLHFPQEPTQHVLDNLRAAASQGAICRLPSKPMLAASIADASLRASLTTSTAYIPAGGSNPVGILGFVNAGLELAAELPAGDGDVYVPAGTGGTAAGLRLGLALAGRRDVRVIAVRVIPRATLNRAIIELLTRRTARLLRSHGVATPTPSPYVIRHDHYGPGYGIATRAAIRAKRLAADAGLYTETTYSAKALAACVDDPPSDRWRAYWHTINGQDVTALIADDFDHTNLPASYHSLFRASEAEHS